MRHVLLPVVLLALVQGVAGQADLTLRDIIEQREPVSPRISPDGRMVAFLVRQSSLADNAARTSLHLVTPDSPPRKLAEEASISQLEWIPDNSGVTAVLPCDGQTALCRVSIKDGQRRPLLDPAVRVSLYAWSPDGARVAYITSQGPEPDEAKRAENEGVIYDDNVFGIRNFTGRNWSRGGGKPEIRIWDQKSGSTVRVGEDLTNATSIRRLAWSPNGQKLSVEYAPASKPEYSMNVSHIAVIDLRTRSTRPVVEWKDASRGAEWSPDSDSLVFASVGDINPLEKFYETRSGFYVWKEPGGPPRRVETEEVYRRLNGARWDNTGKGLLFELENNSRSCLYRIPATGGSASAVIPGTDHFSAFHFDASGRKAAAIRQACTVAPVIVLVDIESGRYTILTDLNPAFRSIRLAEGRELRWKNRFGHETNGFLLLPPGRKEGQKVPLLIITYFFSNKFTTQAQWMTSYPAQLFAASGFGVLLMNYPSEIAWRYGDFKAASFSQGVNPLASMEKAVDMLVEDGTADRERVGIMGWSFGAWLTEYAITHSTIFQAASAGEGGLNNAGQYWVTGAAVMRHYLDAFFGGPPLGDTLRNYQEACPAFNADRISAPLLREYGPDVGVQSLELFAMMRRLGKPVEQVIYPNAPHVLDRPSHRLASMQRNLDWFRFWLQQYEDPDPAKAAQYARWRALRH